MGWLTNPKKAAYNHIYHKTTISVDTLFSAKTKEKKDVKVPEAKTEDILVLNLNENLELIEKSDYKGLKTYIKEKDYELASTIYNKIFIKLKDNSDYCNALEILICSLYLRIYSMLPGDGMLLDVDYFEKHLSKLRKYIKKIPKEYRIKIWEEKRADYIIDEAIKKYLNPLKDEEKEESFIKNIKRYL